MNKLVLNGPEPNDSPLQPDCVEIFPGVPETLARLTAAGYTLAIVSNQPSAAKGKTTRAALETVHQKILQGIQSKGGRIASSHICFHRTEDQCACRKPRTGLLEEAFRQHPDCPKNASWIIGDSLKDIQSGQMMGIQTAFVRSSTQSEPTWAARPTRIVNSLAEFADFLLA